jgi:hypothetical protein
MQEQEKMELRAPKPGESITIVSIEEICIPHGTHVITGTELIHFGSDKATLTLSAPANGTVFYAEGIAEDIEVPIESVVGYILVGNTVIDESIPPKPSHTGSKAEDVVSRKQAYIPRPWQTDPDIARLVQPCYANILEENPKEDVRNAILVGIFCCKEVDGRIHDRDHEALLKELQKDPNLVVGLFSLTLPKNSAEYAHLGGHIEESLETYLRSSPPLYEILQYPNVAPFSLLFGDLEECLSFRQKFTDYFRFKGNKLYHQKG